MDLVLLGVCIAGAWAVTSRTGLSPLAASLWLWVAIVAARTVMPIQLVGTTAEAAQVVGLGVLALAFGAFFVSPPSKATPEGVEERGHPGVALANLVFLSALVLVLVIVGTLTFRASISAVAGVDFAQLTAEQVRRAQNGESRGASPLILLFSLAPLLACLGVYGYRRFSRAWLLLAVVAVAVVMQSPARTAVLTLVVQVAVFLAYSSRKGASTGKSRRRLIPVVAAGVAAIAIFNYIGERLGKNSELAGLFPGYPWPDWTLSPLVYFTGGISALSASLNADAEPFEQGSSVFVLSRLASVVDPDITPPDTIANFIAIPIPFNVYTGFGQVYYDFGYVGVALLLGLAGWLAATSHRRAMEGRAEWMWVSSVMFGLLLGLPLGFRLFNLDTLFQILLGFLIFRVLSRSRRWAGRLYGHRDRPGHLVSTVRRNVGAEVDRRGRAGSGVGQRRGFGEAGGHS